MMTQTKIGITGVHGSGKSTKAEEMYDHYIDIGRTVFMVNEVARKCPYKLGTVEAQEYIWHHQMLREMEAMAQDVDVIICDRTVMDNLMYYRDLLRNAHDVHRWWGLYQDAIEWMPTYTRVIRLPINLEWLQADDPIRPKSEEYALRIDALFDRFVSVFVTGGSL